MTKIDIFSGFLGAGKTTLIKKLLKEAYASEKVVLIENEFGEIGIDAGFLKEAGVNITEISQGCICCSLVGDFTKALKQVISEYEPERVIIEPSGVGKLSDVIRAAQSVVSENIVLNSFTTVVDAGKCKVYLKNFGEFFGDQIKNASSVILSHTDVVKDFKTEEAISLIKELNQDAIIVSTPWAYLDGSVILRAMEKKNTLSNELSKLEKAHKEHHHEHGEECDCGCHGHGEHHHEHGEECDCGCHGHGEHHHEHGEECDCGCHGHGEHHHEYGEECDCGCHGHGEHHHEHGEECECGCHGHSEHHHADEVFSSVGIETSKKFTREEIELALERFDEGDGFGMILRAKGIVPASDGSWIHFDYIPGEADIRYGTADIIGRLCVIGTNIDKEKIKELFGV